MSSEEIEPDAWEIETSDESWHDSKNIDTTIKRHFTYVPAHEREGKQPLFSRETIKQLWIDDYKKCILGEAELLRERGEADVAAQLEHLAHRFEEVFSSDEQ